MCFGCCRPCSYVPDLLPLADLPLLRKLHMCRVELGAHISNTPLTQLTELALLGCFFRDDFEELALQRLLRNILDNYSSLQSLACSTIRSSWLNRDAPMRLGFLKQYRHDSPLHTLCLMRPRTQSISYYNILSRLQGVKVLALPQPEGLNEEPLAKLTTLQALSLAGYKQGFSNLSQEQNMETLVQTLTALKSLR